MNINELKNVRTKMIRNVMTLIMVGLMSSGTGTSAKAMTDRTVAPWVIVLENRAVKTTPAPVGGTYSVKKRAKV